MEVLGLSEGSESESSSSQEDAKPCSTKKPKCIDLETLQQHGYSSGPSILFVPEKPEQEQNWAWSSGAGRFQEKDETFVKRQANREAVTCKAEESAAFARKAAEQSQRLRQEVFEERQRLKHERSMTWNQKEKRKRDAGKQSKGKNYVEEEKRKAREFGIFSGFD